MTPEKGRILWVDDEPFALRYYRAYLEEEGFRVDGVPLASAAKRYYRETHYDLIILDRMMTSDAAYGGSPHEMDLRTGFEIYKDIRTLNHLIPVPIIVFSRFYDPETAEALESMDERLRCQIKGISPPELVALVESLVTTFPVPAIIGGPSLSPIPTEAEFRQINGRRVELLEKEEINRLDEYEETELAWTERMVDRYVDHHYPVPLDVLEEAEAILFSDKVRK